MKPSTTITVPENGSIANAMVATANPAMQIGRRPHRSISGIAMNAPQAKAAVIAMLPAGEPLLPRPSAESTDGA